MHCIRDSSAASRELFTDTPQPGLLLLSIQLLIEQRSQPSGETEREQDYRFNLGSQNNWSIMTISFILNLRLLRFALAFRDSINLFGLIMQSKKFAGGNVTS